MQTWNIDNQLYRAATKDEIAELQNLPGAPHVTFACNCGKTSWSAKNIALSSNGKYNGQRSIFFNGEYPECPCNSNDLVCVVPIP